MSQPHLPRIAAAMCVLLTCLMLDRAQAAIVVDPLSAGATDISFEFFDFFTPRKSVVNPVADPFNAPAGVTALAVGRVQDGALEIDDGSTANLYSVWVGSSQGGSGLLTIRGVGSTLKATSNVNVGSSQPGRFSILDGAEVQAREMQVYSYTAGTQSQLNLSGLNSRLEVEYSIRVGGDGLLSTVDGAEIEADEISITNSYYEPNKPVALATIDGMDSRWELGGALRIGESGDGALTISNSAEVVAGSVRMANFSQSVVPLTLAGGTVRTDALYFSGGQIAGTGSVFAKGMVADVELVFDAAHGLVRQIPIVGQPGVNVELNVTQAGTLGAGYIGNGSLTIADGRILQSVEGVLGQRYGSFGKATVDGLGSKWHVLGDLSVGVEGVGELAIEDGAAVQVNGYLFLGRNFDGTDSRIQLNGGELSVGILAASTDQLRGAGTIHTEQFQFDGQLVFDQPGDHSHQLILDDLPSQNVKIEFGASQLGSLVVGYRKTGSVEIRNAAKLHSAAGFLGEAYESRGDVLVTGPGSEWHVDDELRVGSWNGQAAAGLLVSDGGLVTSHSLGVHPSGRVEVGGPDSRLEAHDLDFRPSNQDATPGILRVHSGGFAEFETFSNFDDGSLVGIILVEGEGSRLNFRQGPQLSATLVQVRDGGELSIGNEDVTGGALQLGTGTIHLDGGTVDMFGGTIDADQGNFIFEGGLLRHVRTFDGYLLQLGGRLESGFSRLTVNGTYFQDAEGALSIGMSGSGETESVRVNGVAILEGALEVESFGDLPTTVSQNQSPYNVLVATQGIIGSFEDYFLPELADGLSWSVRQTFNRIDLEIIAGDFNGDLMVDAADYTVWRDMLYQQVEQGASADGDRNGFIDDRDFDVWKSFFGRRIVGAAVGNASVFQRVTFQSTTVESVVPEPASCLLLLAGIWAFAASCARRCPR